MSGYEIEICDSCGIAFCSECLSLGRCSHGRCYCPKCEDQDSVECPECAREWAADVADDYTWGATAAAGLRRLYDPDHGRMTHTGRAGDES